MERLRRIEAEIHPLRVVERMRRERDAAGVGSTCPRITECEFDIPFVRTVVGLFYPEERDHAAIRDVCGLHANFVVAVAVAWSREALQLRTAQRRTGRNCQIHKARVRLSRIGVCERDIARLQGIAAGAGPRACDTPDAVRRNSSIPRIEILEDERAGARSRSCSRCCQRVAAIHQRGRGEAPGAARIRRGRTHLG